MLPCWALSLQVGGTAQASPVGAPLCLGGEGVGDGKGNEGRSHLVGKGSTHLVFEDAALLHASF